MKKQYEFDNSHERARWLIDKELIEGLAQDEQRWLANHVAACESCAHRGSATEAAVRALKSVSVQVPRRLAASTSLRVREKATKLKAERARNLAMIVGCTVSWVAGVASAPLVWRFCEWMGTTLNLPKIVWELGFVSWWLVPAAGVGLVILAMRARELREDFNSQPEAGLRQSRW